MTGAGARDRSGSWRRPVLAGALANLAAGTLFGWSLVADRAAEAVGISREGSAVVFGAAIAVFAAALLALGPLLRRAGSRRLLRAAAALGGGGLLLAATAQHPLVLGAGIALLFGAANGVAYGVAVALAAGVRSRRGTATGLVVGAYAAGPVLLGLVAPAVLDAAGWRPSMTGLAVVVAALLAGAAQVAPPAGRDERPRGRPARPPRRTVALLWVVFAGGTAPGLLFFAHAVALAGDRALRPWAAGLAVSALAAGNLAGRLVAGVWSDRIGRLPALGVALSTGAASVAPFALPAPPALVLVGFLGTGLAYGAVSALAPAATADRVAAEAFPAAYGVVFTGWGVAGLLAPLAGGPLLRLSGQAPAWLALAAVPAVAAAVAVLLLAGRAPRRVRGR